MENKSIMNKYIVSALLAMVLTGCGTPANIKDVETKKVKEIPLGGESKPLQFKKIVIKLKRGQHIGAMMGGLLCLPMGDLNWKGGKLDVSSDDFNEVFREVLESANYTVVGDPDALFDDPSLWKAEYLIAGLIKNLDANICYPMAGFGDYTNSRGEAYIKVEWQIYSRLDREVVLKSVSEGNYKVTDSNSSGGLDAILGAFEEAATNLLANQEFYSLISDAKRVVAKTESGAKFDEIVIKQGIYKKLLGSDGLSKSRTNVVTVFAGDGHGSGYFISSEGHIMTNAHVVGGAKYVAIRMSDGSDVVGKVVRKNKRRDVALVKIDKSTTPITLRTRPAVVGEEVYAIGSPLDEKFSATVSKGIVSGYRDEEGLDYLQSDVNVLPGNSGGPLLDKNGELVGMTVSGIMFHGAPSGMNFFIPVYSALDSLSISVDGKPR